MRNIWKIDPVEAISLGMVFISTLFSVGALVFIFFIY